MASQLISPSHRMADVTLDARRVGHVRQSPPTTGAKHPALRGGGEAPEVAQAVGLNIVAEE
jgi:hypothetical protein